MPLTDVKAWSDAAKSHGIVSILLTVLILINAGFGYMLFQQVPQHLSAISAGYEKNAKELDHAADKFAGAALRILEEYKADRMADRQAMIELIRAGDLNSGQVAEAFEKAAEKRAERQDNRNGSG